MFFAGWAILLDYLLVPTLLYVAGAVALGTVVPGIPQWAWIVLFLIVNTTINYLGIETTAKMNIVFLAFELVVLAIFLVIGVAAVARGVNGATFTLDPLFNPDVMSAGLIFGALSIAVLSFLGFDAISTLAEETRGGRMLVGRATVIALCLVAVLFIAQTYVAALLVPNQTSFDGDEATNNAFYDIAALAGGGWLKVLVAVTGAIATALANSLVAQAATSRLLFSMARDGKLPRFLAHVHPTRKVPERAILVVAGITLVLGLFLVGQIGLLSSLVNFGALFAFLLLHASVVVYYVVRQRSRQWLQHLVIPVLGFAIIAYVLVNASNEAKLGGLSWLVIGAIVYVVLRVSGRSTKLPVD